MSVNSYTIRTLNYIVAYHISNTQYSYVEKTKPKANLSKEYSL